MFFHFWIESWNFCFIARIRVSFWPTNQGICQLKRSPTNIIHISSSGPRSYRCFSKFEKKRLILLIISIIFNRFAHKNTFFEENVIFSGIGSLLLAEVDKTAAKKQMNIYTEAVQKDSWEFFKSRKFLSDIGEPGETLRTQQSSWFQVSFVLKIFVNFWIKLIELYFSRRF